MRAGTQGVFAGVPALDGQISLYLAKYGNARGSASQENLTAIVWAGANDFLLAPADLANPNGARDDSYSHMIQAVPSRHTLVSGEGRMR
jgi:hypothetical protein